MSEKTFEMDGIKATVYTETGLAVISKRVLLSKLPIGDDMTNQLTWEFVRAVSQSKNVVVPFTWPSETVSEEVIVKAYHDFFALSGRVVRTWLNAITEVDTAPGDFDLSPLAGEKKDETPPSPQSEITLEST